MKIIVTAKSKIPKSELEPYNPFAVCKSKDLKGDKLERCIHHIKDQNKKTNKKKKAAETKDWLDLLKTAKKEQWMKENASNKEFSINKPIIITHSPKK